MKTQGVALSRSLNIFVCFSVQLNWSSVLVSHVDRLGGFMVIFIPIVRVDSAMSI